MSSRALPDSLSADQRRVLSPEGLRSHRRRVRLVGTTVSLLTATAWVVLLVASGAVSPGDLGFGLAFAAFLGGIAGSLCAPLSPWVALRAQVAAAEGRGRGFRPIRRAVLRNEPGPLSPEDHDLAVRWARVAAAAGQLVQQSGTPALVGLSLVQLAVLLDTDRAGWQSLVALVWTVLAPLMVVAQVAERRRLLRFLAAAGADRGPARR